MDGDEDWNAFLKDHPIFKNVKGKRAETAKGDASLELSLNSLPDFTTDELDSDALTPSGRRQVMVIKDYELILAVGNQIRIAPLGDVKSSRSSVPEQKTYKVLNTPNVGFDIHQMVVNPNGKFLAVAGAFHVTVVLLPRSGLTRLVSDVVDCKSISIGQYYHALNEAPIAKIDWHPWGNGGTTLLVMTVDGKLREYDIAVDIEEPQQVLSFVPQKSTSYLAEDESEREVASFTLGRGKADWGPLSIYAVMKSGDIYAICPYMPQNALIPSSYVHALECFVAAKQEFLSQSEVDSIPSSSSGLATVYDYQRKYVSALLKQLPPGTAFPSTPRMVLMHPPTTIRNPPVRQGPFLLQPAPRTLEGSEGGDATDIIYLSFGGEGEEIGEGEVETERLGVVLVAFQDGKVDLFLDVEKVEARWERKHSSQNQELPMLAVYESIDLGIIAMLSQVSPRDGEPPILELIRGNHPVLSRDPINDESIYVYHAFGVHAIQLGALLQKLANALRDDVSNDGEESLGSALEASGGATVTPLVTTFSIERRCSNPVTAVAIPNDVYLTYSIFILTSAMRVVTIPLTLQSENRAANETLSSSDTNGQPGAIEGPSDGPPAYISFLTEPYEPPTKFTNDNALPSNPKLVVPVQSEIQLTPDTLRYLALTVQRLADQMHEIQIAYRSAELRAQLQEQEFRRQQNTAQDILTLNDELHGKRQEQTREKVSQVQSRQKELLNRTDRILRAMMKNASPELSEHETKWFEELKRLQKEIKGSTRYDQDSLSTRTAHLRKEFDRLLPGLKDLKQKEERIQKRLSEVNALTGIGASQAFEFGVRSSKERTRIENVEAEILKLATKLDVTLNRPPSTQDPSGPEKQK